MEQGWYFKVPDFNNQNEWVEDKPLDYYFDPSTDKVMICSQGKSPGGLKMGVIMPRHNRRNSLLILYEYRDLEGKRPLLLQWWDKADKERTGMALVLGEKQQVKQINERLVCDINYDPECGLVINHAFTFQIDHGQSKLN